MIKTTNCVLEHCMSLSLVEVIFTVVINNLLYSFNPDFNQGISFSTTINRMMILLSIFGGFFLIHLFDLELCGSPHLLVRVVELGIILSQSENIDKLNENLRISQIKSFVTFNTSFFNTREGYPCFL